jgi:hypothetical protein
MAAEDKTRYRNELKVWKEHNIRNEPTTQPAQSKSPPPPPQAMGNIKKAAKLGSAARESTIAAVLQSGKHCSTTTIMNHLDVKSTSHDPTLYSWQAITFAPTSATAIEIDQANLIHRYSRSTGLELLAETLGQECKDLLVNLFR